VTDPALAPDAGPGTLVDSIVLLDLFIRDRRWMQWSSEQLTAALDTGPVLINPVVYSEVSLRFSTIEALDVALSADRSVRAQVPWPAAFLAARAHRARRSRGADARRRCPISSSACTRLCWASVYSPGTRPATAPTSPRQCDCPRVMLAISVLVRRRPVKVAR
jgi:hypothetical protein